MINSNKQNNRCQYKTGDIVVAMRDMGDSPNEDSPGGVYALKGELLVIRNVHSDGREFSISVSHEHITDNSFGVRLHEIKMVGEVEDQGAYYFIDKIKTDSALKYRLWINGDDECPYKFCTLEGAKIGLSNRSNRNDRDNLIVL